LAPEDNQQQTRALGLTSATGLVIGTVTGVARSWPSKEDPMDLYGRSLLKETDLGAEEFLFLVGLGERLRAEKRRGVTGRRLAGRNIALIFEKTSTRTRSAFEVAAYDEGGHVTYLGPGESQLGYKESVKDTARVLGRMFDGIEYRGFAQESIEVLGEFAGVPVWNGLTDTWHPTQMLADILTMSDHSTKPLAEVSFCYLGDGRNNTANSLMVTGATLGMDARICAPAALQPSAEVRGIAADLAAGSGARLLVTADVNAGVAGVDFVYTDVWLSLGEPEDQWDTRIDQLLPYQVNAAVMKATGNPAVKFLHCLPALHNRDTQIGQRIYDKRGLDALEVTDEVFESPASVVFDQAENRMHTIKALMIATVPPPAHEQLPPDSRP
jgi:ornithine carbamoyltransferase